MKKIVLSVAVLSAALAQAQVGINQEVPKATLDITVKKENIDNESQEGLLIPRVTKEKALKMANNTTAPEESVLIYVNDVENYASGSDVKVDDITEKGYYFWNGAKWVKSSGANGELWAQRQNASITETYLKPAEVNNDFVGYNSNRNFRLNLGEVTREQTNAFSLYGDVYGLAIGESPVEFYTSSDVLPLKSTYGNPSLWGYQFFFNRNVAILKEDHVAAAVAPITIYGEDKNDYIAGDNYIIAKDVTSEVGTVRASHNRAHLYSNGTVQVLQGVRAITSAGSSDGTYSPTVGNNTAILSTAQNYGTSGYTSALTAIVENYKTTTKAIGLATGVKNYGVADEITGLKTSIVSQSADENDDYPTHSIKNIRGIHNYVRVSSNATVEDWVMGNLTSVAISENVTMTDGSSLFGNYGRIRLSSNLLQNDIYSNRSRVDLTSNGSGAKNIYLNQSIITSPGTGTTIAENVYGFDFRNNNSNNWTADRIYGAYLDHVDNAQTGNYGLYIESIGNSSATENYAVYTNEGNIRFGDLAGSGNRMVVADSDGKLIVGGEVTNFTSLWENTNNNSIKLKNTSTGTPRTEKNSFVITDNDLVGVGTETPRFKMHLVSSGENSYYPTALGIETYRNDPGTGAIDIIKARGTKENPEAVQNGDFGGGIHMVGHDGTSAVAMSRIATKVDGTVATGDIPSSFYFDFYRNGSYKTALKIDANGNLGLGSVNPQISFAIKSNHTGLDYVESQGLFLVNNATSDNASGIRSFGAVEISADHNANFSASTGRFEGITFKTSGQERMRIMENGKIKASSLAGSGERIVTADADGVLKTNTTSLADLESLWKKESGRIVLKEDSTGAIRTSTSGSRNDVTISDDGKITARGFVGYNGATIFPDYVFEKYYTGESTIKADYNFHNLESVESFIKTNGHLPGYTSAKEIAEKGLIDISATQLTNVEKIEELYLHTIEQEKAIKSQKEELKAKDAKIAELEARLSKIEQSLNK